MKNDKMCKRYKFVKFSKATAKSSPGMIYREYEKIINSKIDEINSYLKKKNNALQSKTIFTLPVDDISKAICVRVERDDWHHKGKEKGESTFWFEPAEKDGLGYIKKGCASVHIVFRDGGFAKGNIRISDFYTQDYIFQA